MAKGTKTADNNTNTEVQTAPAAQEAIDLLTKGAKSLIKTSESNQSMPLFKANDLNKVPLGDRDGYYTKSPVFIQTKSEPIRAELRVSYKGTSSPLVGVAVPATITSALGTTEELQWTNYKLSEDQEGFWASLTNSEEGNAYVASLILTGKALVFSQQRN